MPLIGCDDVGVGTFDPEALRRVRTDRELSHDALADLVGIARPNLIAYEKGRRRPSPPTVVMLAKALRVNPLELTTADPQRLTLEDLRIRAGLEKAAAARLADIPRRTYDSIEQGEGRLAPDTAERLAKAFGARKSEILRAYEISRSQAAR